MSITGCRNDALVQSLNAIGYQPIKLAMTGIQPPEMYQFCDGNLMRLGELADYLPAGTVIPPLRTGELADTIQHSETSRKKVSEAASFLGDALKCIGITSAPKIDLSFLQSTQVTFSFNDVTYETLDISKIHRLLAGGLLTPGIAPEDIREGTLRIVYDYAYASSLSLNVARVTGSTLDLTALQIEQFFNLGVQGSVHATSAESIVFTGKSGARSAFACKLGRIEKHGKNWYFYPQDDAGSAFLADDATPQPYLLERGVVFNVETK